MLTRLIYVSTAQDGVDLQEFKKILLQSQSNNLGRDLTGMLVFSGNMFLQVLEGGRERVNTLYGSLVRDTRHHSLTMLSYVEVEERQWPNWAMGFATPNADNRALFLKYSSDSSFNPYRMRAQAVDNLLQELAPLASRLRVQ